jgi:hypothetical protein
LAGIPWFCVLFSSSKGSLYLCKNKNKNFSLVLKLPQYKITHKK